MTHTYIFNEPPKDGSFIYMQLNNRQEITGALEGTTCTLTMDDNLFIPDYRITAITPAGGVVMLPLWCTGNITIDYTQGGIIYEN